MSFYIIFGHILKINQLVTNVLNVKHVSSSALIACRTVPITFLRMCLILPSLYAVPLSSHSSVCVLFCPHCMPYRSHHIPRHVSSSVLIACRTVIITFLGMCPLLTSLHAVPLSSHSSACVLFCPHYMPYRSHHIPRYVSSSDLIACRTVIITFLGMCPLLSSLHAVPFSSHSSVCVLFCPHCMPYRCHHIPRHVSSSVLIACRTVIITFLGMCPLLSSLHAVPFSSHSSVCVLFCPHCMPYRFNHFRDLFGSLRGLVVARRISSTSIRVARASVPYSIVDLNTVLWAFYCKGGLPNIRVCITTRQKSNL